jgi:hypothetical protein
MGGTNYYSTVRILGNGNAYWSYSGGTANASTTYDGNATPIDFQPTAGGNRTTDGYSTVTVTNMPIATNVRVRITLLNDNTSERWLVDDFKVTGTLAATYTSTLASSATLSEPVTISPLNTAFTGASAPQQNAVANFDFNFVNSDASPTQFSQLIVNAGTGNGVTSWTNALQEAQLSDGTNTVTTTTIGATSITFASLPNGAGNIGHIPVGTKTYTLTVRFKTTMGGTTPTTIDGQDFVFLVNNGGFTFVAGGLASSQAVNSGDGNNTVAVVASQLAFITQPSNTTVSATMTSPTVQAIDANNNRDLGYVTTISITSTGALDASPKTAVPASGLATFTGASGNIIHTISGMGLTLTATSGSLTSAISNTFNITTIINSENFGACGSLTWNAVNVLGATDVWSCGTSQMLMNGFGDENDEDWLIVGTPINFNAYANETMTFTTQERFNGPDLELYYSTNFSGTFDATNVSSATWTLIPHTWNDTSTSPTLSGAFNNTVNLSSITGTAYIAFKYTGTSGSAEEWIVDNISIIGTLTGANLSTSVSTRTGFTYAQGAGPSTSQSFTVSGANLSPLSDNITITASANYEVSTDNVTFSGTSVTIAYTGGSLSNIPVYVRLKAGLTAGNYNSENIVISGGSASSVQVTCSGNVFVLPQVALSSPNPAIASYNIIRGTTNNVIYRFDLAVIDADATLTNISFSTGASDTYAASNLTNIKIWYSPDATFTGSGNDVQLRSKTTNLKTNPQTFTAFSQTITAGNTGYFFLTTDVVCAAGEGNTISVNAITTSDLTVTLGNKTGTAFASGTHTFVASAPNDITSPTTTTCQNGGTTIGWTLPTGCYDAVLVFATSGSFTSALPTGNGGAYTANTVFGSGTAFDGGFCVYKGTGTSVNVTGLTNGTNYTYNRTFAYLSIKLLYKGSQAVF